MKKIALLLLFAPMFANAQCDIEFLDDTLLVCPNSSVEFHGFVNGGIISEEVFDFNSVIPPGWTVSGGASFGQMCLPSLDGTNYYWASTAGGGVPSIESDNYYFAFNGSVSFDLVFATQGGASPCEGPDEQDEGVSIQYSVDNGLTWITFAYFNPSGVIEPTESTGNTSVANGPTAFTSWNNYVLPFPAAVLGSVCKFRWIQNNSSGTCCDNWGLDNIHITLPETGYTLDWSTGAIDTNSISVSSTVDTSFIAYGYDSLGVLQCQDTCHLAIIDTGYDNGVQLITGIFATTQQSYAVLDAYNSGCPMTSGFITVELDTALIFVSSVPAPISVFGNTLTYDYAGLEANSPHFVSQMEFSVSPFTQVGDTVIIDVSMSDSIGDINITNNARHYVFPVLASYDPNDKRVYPRGDCIPGYVLNDQMLTYTVRFQNTGTAPALNVRIKDVIDPSLDPSTLKVVAASDEVYLNWTSASTVEFMFDSIMLPTQLSSDTESSGYVVFEVDQYQNVPLWTPINNSAEIYFDMNPAIITNNVLNTVSDGSHYAVGDTLEVTVPSVGYVWNGQFLSIGGVYTQTISRPNDCDSIAYFSLIITDQIGLDELNKMDLNFYPNPTTGIVKINGVSGEGIVEVFNATGETVFRTKYSEGQEIDLSLLAKGLYVIEYTVANAHHRGRLIITE